MIDIMGILYYINNNFLFCFFVFFGILILFYVVASILFPGALSNNTGGSKRTGTTTTMYKDGKMVNINYFCPHCKRQLQLFVVDEIFKTGVASCPFCGKAIYKDNL